MADVMGIVVPHRNEQILFLLGQLNSVFKGLPQTPAHDAQSYKPCLEPAVAHSQEGEVETEAVCRCQYLVNGFDKNMSASTF